MDKTRVDTRENKVSTSIRSRPGADPLYLNVGKFNRLVCFLQASIQLYFFFSHSRALTNASIQGVTSCLRNS